MSAWTGRATRERWQRESWRPEVRVRTARPADARPVARIQVDTWRAAYAGIVPQPVLDAMNVGEGEEGWRAWIADEGGRLFVAENADGAVGFASVGHCRDLERVGELYAIYVLPERWGAGVGGALMDAAAEWLLARWAEAVLWVAKENPRARAFYERLGWIPEESRVEEVAPGTFVPEVRYRLSRLDRLGS